MPTSASSLVRLSTGTELPCGSIYCFGRTYPAHVRELGNPPPQEPVLFLKATSSLRPLQEGPLAYGGETFHFEGELVLLVGSIVPMGSQPSWDCLAGVGLGIDLTRREKQNELKAAGLPWTVAKSFAGAALVSEFEPLPSPMDPVKLSFTVAINGEHKQDGQLADLYFSVPELLRFLSEGNELRPGDLIFTGTPAGVGAVAKGDRITLAFPALGKTYNGTL